MEIQWPLILFTFFNCLAGGIFLMQGILTLSGKGKAMQFVSCVSAIVALAIGGLSVFFHLQHPLRMLNGFGHITSGITIELIFVIVFAIAVVLYFLMMRRSEEGVAPQMVRRSGHRRVAGPAVRDGRLLPDERHSRVGHHAAASVLRGGHGDAGRSGRHDHRRRHEGRRRGEAVRYGGLRWRGGVRRGERHLCGGYLRHGRELYRDAVLLRPDAADVAMRQSEQITGAILAGEHAVAFWLGNVAIGCAVPAVLAALVMTGKIPAEKALAVAVVALVCAVIGTIVWRVLLYEVAVNALIQFQWAL